MKTITELTARLLDASESMTRYLHDHTEELARGEEPHVFTATNAYAELQEATVDLRHGIELSQALAAQGIPGEITCPIQGLIAMHGQLLEVMPHAYFELAYTRTTGWMVWICNKPATGTPGEPGYGSNRQILACGQGYSPEEACDKAIDALMEEPEVFAPNFLGLNASAEA